MDLFSLMAKLSLDSSDYNSGINKAEGVLSKFGDVAKKTGAVVAGVLTTATGAVVGLTKQAVEAYAEYEQLIGGVETLYQSSVDDAGSVASKVLENAQNAFETAGMSANEYMETVTSMSASLIQSTGRGQQQDLEALQETLDEEYESTKRSLDDQYAIRKSYWDEQIKLEKNKDKKQSLKEARDAELKELKRSNEDTLKEMKKHNKETLAEAERANMASETSEESLMRASELADMAIIDMSDNANKMGTDIESIKNAYAGFAKQNYSMLDNLKVGYGGSKEEMERLLQDAEALTGVHYDINSYADIVEAIHAIQTELGITGTTAEEASSTIEGSTKAMKSAWENLLVTFADKKGNTKKATENLVRTAKAFYKNISPVITQAISGIGEFLSEIAPMVGEELPGIIADLVPKLFSAGASLVKGLAKGVISAIGKIKWPSWEDVKAFALTAWNSITEAVQNLGGLIFGENEEGEVNWPTWDDIVKVAEQLWNDIITFVANLPETIGKLIFGENEDGTVNFPTWDQVKEAITGAWTTICTEAGRLTGFNLGDISSVGDLIGQIEEKWKKLRETIESKAIEIGKYFFGEGKEKEIADAVKNILDVLVAFGAGFAVFKAVTGIKSIVKTLKGLFTLDMAGSKVALILAGLATAFMLIYENWDVVQPVLQQAWEWIDTNIVQPMSEFFSNLSDWVTGAINDIKRLLGLEVREGESLLSNIEAGNLKNTYQFMVNTKNGKANPNGIKITEEQFYNKLNDTLTEAGFKAEEIEAITQMIKDADDPEWVKTFIDNLQKADEKAKALGTAIDENIPTDVDVSVNLNLNDPDNLLDILSGHSSGGGAGGSNMAMHTATLNAKGNWSVPYDGFLASLHRGEMVLTSSQARDYRAGNGNVDLAGLEDRIESAIRAGMANAQVNAYIDGDDVTDKVNRRNINAVKSRRFAT